MAEIPTGFEDLPTGSWDRLDRAVKAFEDAWQRGECPRLDDYLPPEGPQRRRLLAELAGVDLERRLKAGGPAAVEVYLGRYPELNDDPGAVLDLVAAEYEICRRRDPRTTPAEYLRRFPQHADALQRRLAQPPAPAGPEEPPAAVHPASAQPASTTSGTPSPSVPAEPETLPPAPVEEAPTLPPRTPVLANGQQTASGPGSPSTVAVAPRLPQVSGYEVLEKLGEGGMGVVYKARQVALKRLVALKMIRSGSLAGEHELARFRAEAEAVARLQHPNIVQIFEVGEFEGLPFFSLEYVEGSSLHAQLDGTPWPAPKAAHLVETLARAMHAAHQAGIVHRNLKPHNVLLSFRRCCPG